MKHTNEMMLMIAKFLFGEYGAEDFSFEFPAALSNVYETFHTENPRLSEFLEDQMPELCASFDPHGTGDPDTLGEERFRAEVLRVYRDAIPFSLRAS